MLALAHELRRLRNSSSARSSAGVFSTSEKFVGGFDGALGKLFGRFLKSSDNLRSLAGLILSNVLSVIMRSPPMTSGYSCTQLALNFVDRCAHRLRVFFFAKIGKRFVTKFVC